LFVASLAAITTAERDDVKKTDLQWTDDESGVTIEMTGSIEFSTDDTRIVDMETGARLKVKRKKAFLGRSLEVKKGSDGRLVYTYRYRGRERPFDDEAAAWLAELLPRSLAEAGVGADARVAKRYRDEGIDGTLQLIREINSDFGQANHYQALLRLDELDAAQRSRAIRETGHEIESDFMRRMALEDFIYSGDLGREELEAVLFAARSIDSDFETSSMLNSIDSDLLDDDDSARLFFEVVASMDSDFMKATVLLRLARDARKDASLRERYREAAKSIDSEFEYSRVMNALGTGI